MNDILAFAQELIARPGYKKLLYKAEDAVAVKTLDTQLTHAFQVFEVPITIHGCIPQLLMPSIVIDTVQYQPSYFTETDGTASVTFASCGKNAPHLRIIILNSSLPPRYEGPL
jgi:hypothetical protein